MVARDGVALPLPPSRKVLALLGYLALEPAAHPRGRLCDLLWDAANDPRGELRWCLSKLRALVDDAERSRVLSLGQATIALDLSEAVVDTREVEEATAQGLTHATTERLAQLAGLLRGDLLEGIELAESAELSHWLSAQRQHFRTLRMEIARELWQRAVPGSEEAHTRARAWVGLAPFERRAHESLLSSLLQAGRLRDADEHVAATIRSFEREGADWSPLRTWWHVARAEAASQARGSSATSLEVVTGPEPSRRRAAVAVMPFLDSALGSAPSQLALGLTDDIITRLAKLRVLFVIARGSSYALAERGIDAREAGRILNVEYVVSGRLRSDGPRQSVLVELSETREARIVWTDELSCDGRATFAVLDAIVDKIVAAVAEEIEAAECQRAILKPPSSLTAWEHYHRGLWHMYRFNGPDNRDAAQYFRSALDLDPTFARAHAGLSFTHFQNVFLELSSDRERQLGLALSTAESSLMADDRDPAAHWAMGRALWLRGAKDESVAELRRSIELSPNFALGHYTLGFVEAQSGDPLLAIQAADTSSQLSPFDPLQFGMLGTRALSLLRLGEREQAVSWALKAISRPNAHVHILAIAASALSLSNRLEQGRELVSRMRQRSPDYDVERFLRAFHFDGETERMLRQGARGIGFG